MKNVYFVELQLLESCIGTGYGILGVIVKKRERRKQTFLTSDLGLQNMQT